MPMSEARENRSAYPHLGHRRVVIIQPALKKYRVPLFQGLYSRLSLNGVDTTVVYGDTDQEGNRRSDAAELEPPAGTPVKNVWLLSRRLLYQPAWRHLRDANLVVVEQANKNLFNYVLIILSAFKVLRVAFWGHGRDFSASPKSLSERLKRAMATRVDWWFAYTPGVAHYLASLGVPHEQITVVQNTVDVDGFYRELDRVTERELLAYRSSLGVPHDAAIALQCGSLHHRRRVPFLLEAAQTIRRTVPRFHLLIAGDGPELDIVRHAAQEHPWIHLIRRIDGRAKARAFRLARVFLNPGMIGLAIVDAFAAGLPVLTTDVPDHSPEIEYLRPGYNGFITEASVAAFAAAAARVITDVSVRQSLSRGARETARDLSMENMVDRFASGILAALGQ